MGSGFRSSRASAERPPFLSCWARGEQPPRSALSRQEEDNMVQVGQSLLKQYNNLRVIIRFALGGCTNRPYYRIVVAHNKRARDGKYLDQIGCYDPLPNDHAEKIVGLNFERLKYWLANGATMTKPIEKLLGLSGFLPLHPMTVTNAERVKKERALEAARAAEEETLAEKEEEQQLDAQAGVEK